MDEAEQRRTAPRVVQKFMVRYRPNAQAPWRPSTLRDLSREGIRFVCEETFEPGQSLELQFGLPLFPQSVQLSGRVAWKKPVFSGSLQMAEYGVNFTALEAGIRQTLDVAVQRFLKQRS